MKNHWWKLIVFALAVAIVAGCSSKQSTSGQSANNTAARTVNAAPTDKAASDKGNASQETASAESKAATLTKSVKPGNIYPPSTPAKGKAASAGAATRTAAAKPASNKANVQKTDLEKNVKPQAVANTPKQLPKLLDLGATKCIPCKMMVPVLDELTKEYKGKLKVEFIDVWENPSAAEKYGVQSIPTQIFFDANGKEVYRHIGYFPKEDIVKSFREKGIKL